MKNYLKPISMTFMATLLVASSAHAGILDGFKKLIPLKPIGGNGGGQVQPQQPAELSIAQKNQLFLNSGMNGVQSLQNTSPELSQAVISALSAGSMDISGVRIDTQKLREIYGARKNLVAWTNNKGFSQMGWTLQEVLSSMSVWHGLQPEKYLSPAVLDRVDAMASSTAPSKKDLVEIEILLTQVYWNFIKDMSTGQINPADPSQNLQDFEFKKMAAPAANIVAMSTLSANSLYEGIDLMSPPYNGYKYLQNSLANIEDAQKNNAFGDILSQDVIKPGDRHPNVIALRQRLVAFGYLGIEERNNNDITYDGKMVQAMMRFQKQHNLGMDGVIGKGSYGILARPISAFKNQIKANMEKWRFYPRGSGKFIMVDMGRQELDVIDNGNRVMTKRVVVGGDLTGTPTMADRVVRIKFAPDWTSPNSIVVKETIPQFGSRPSAYFESHPNVQVMAGGRALTMAEIDAIDWKKYTVQSPPPYQFVEKNGESSSLGLIKFELTNGHSIYLHDTGNRNVFNRDERFLSHGCVRVENPFDLAAYLNPRMDQATGLQPGEINMLMSNSPEDLRQFTLDHTLQPDSKPFYAPVDQIPVYIFGTTTVIYIDTNVSIAFGRDVYKQDERIINALKLGQ
jgi:murein L,D-transpeptidase YcbB/YkuD